MTRQTTRDDNANVQIPNIDVFTGRLNVAIEMAGGSTIMANKAKVSTSALSKWRLGKSEPTLTNLVNLAQAGGVDLTWLATGEGSPDGPIWFAADQGSAAPSERSESDPAYASIERYDVRAAAGHGAVVPSERIAETLMFKRSWINQELNANPADLYLINVDGESMEPTLRPGDMILVDRRSAQSVPRDGIYVLRMDGSLLVKRLQRLPGRRVRVTSDNPAYEAFDLLLDDSVDDLAIIGRVVWAGRRM